MDIINIDPNTQYMIKPDFYSTGFTSLMYLVMNTRENPEYLEQIEYILDNNPDELDKKNTYGWTALILSVRNYDTYSTINTVKLLLSYKPDIYLNTNRNTAFRCALFMSFELSDIFLEHGADINHEYRSGRTILHNLAVVNLRHDLVRYLLENTNIDIHKKDHHNYTARDYAVDFKNIEFVKILDDYDNLDIKCALD